MKNILKLVAVALIVVVFSGCANNPSVPYDYTEYKLSNPKSILVLPLSLIHI